MLWVGLRLHSQLIGMTSPIRGMVLAKYAFQQKTRSRREGAFDQDIPPLVEELNGGGFLLVDQARCPAPTGWLKHPSSSGPEQAV